MVKLVVVSLNTSREYEKSEVKPVSATGAGGEIAQTEKCPAGAPKKETWSSKMGALTTT